MQSKSQSLYKESFKEGEKKFYEFPNWSFEVSSQSFILIFKLSDQSFEVRGHAEVKEK